MTEKRTKMVLVLRSDLKDTKGQKIRTGKIGTQAGHAASDWLLALLTGGKVNQDGEITVRLTDEEKEWIEDGMHRKVCVKVPDENTLMELYQKAKDAGLTVHLVTDAGLTQFGEPTRTALGIGPHYDDKIDPLTGHLELL
jgi:PTH2 family peptidyl-tRNA hydrolase